MEKRCKVSRKTTESNGSLNIQLVCNKKPVLVKEQAGAQLLGKQPPVNNWKPLGAGSHSTARGKPCWLCFLMLWSRSSSESESSTDCILYALNIVSVSQAHSALHHLGSQYSGIRCIREDAGPGFICSGCGAAGCWGWKCHTDFIIKLRSPNVRFKNLCWYCGW